MLKKLALLFTLTCISLITCAQTNYVSPWPKVNKLTRPWTRWWWMGSAVDEKNLGLLLNKYAAAGIGGVEVTPIYGAMGFEERYIEFLSPKWMDMLRFSVKKAGALGMGVDMNTGTGWPFGGPQITPEFAASKLIVQTYSVDGGKQIDKKIVADDPKQKGAVLQALTAYGSKGETLNLTTGLTADGSLNWVAPASSNWTVYAAFLGKTAQQVKRSAPGGAGFTMDHLSKNSLDAYLKRFDAAFGGSNPGVGCFFNDSYEVYDADFSAGLFTEFKKMHGYDARDFIRELSSKESSDRINRVKADYRETMSAMVLNNFTRPWTTWAHSKNALTRNQAHGAPANILDLYASVDIPECETFGLTRFPVPGLNFYTNDTRNVPPDPIMMKFASSGAHVMGKPLTSSETFTWLGEHFKVPLSHCKTEVDQVFLTGVNHVFFHGTTYSPQDAIWPGWQFYASVEFSPQNSFWPHLKGMNDYITRCQSVLQAGKADNELLIYWPVNDVWYDAPPKLDMQISIHSIDKWLHPTPFYDAAKKLMNVGYSVDYVSDHLLAGSKVAAGSLKISEAGNAYKALIVPETKYMPVETFKNIINLARSGATVIMQNLPADVPGYRDPDVRRKQLKELVNALHFIQGNKGTTVCTIGKGKILLAPNLQQAVPFAGIDRETLVDNGLKFIRRDVNGSKTYFIVNHTASAVNKSISLAGNGNVTILDPLTGEFGTATSSPTGNGTKVRIQVPAGGSLILKFSKEKMRSKPWKYIESESTPVKIDGNWDLEFTSGGPEVPAVKKLQHLVSWTDLKDEKALNFSGSAEYSTTFTISSVSAAQYLLRLGDVRESAHVWVNGKDAGILWSVPYQVDIKPYLKAGQNTLKIEVANLMANRIRDLDKRKVEWRKYREINFVNLNYAPFDAANWEDQPSGLLGPVSVVAVN